MLGGVRVGGGEHLTIAFLPFSLHPPSAGEENFPGAVSFFRSFFLSLSIASPPLPLYLFPPPFWTPGPNESQDLPQPLLLFLLLLILLLLVPSGWRECVCAPGSWETQTWRFSGPDQVGEPGLGGGGVGVRVGGCWEGSIADRKRLLIEVGKGSSLFLDNNEAPVTLTCGSRLPWNLQIHRSRFHHWCCWEPQSRTRSSRLPLNRGSFYGFARKETIRSCKVC